MNEFGCDRGEMGNTWKDSKRRANVTFDTSNAGGMEIGGDQTIIQQCSFAIPIGHITAKILYRGLRYCMKN